MNRRGFLGAIAAAIAGATLDPERALWLPGKKLISIPKPRQLQAHRMGYSFELGPRDLSSPGRVQSLFFGPAMQSLADSIDKHYAIVTPQVLDLPKGLERAEHIMLPNGLPGRLIVGYAPTRISPVEDFATDGGWFGRVDAAFLD